MVTLVFYIFHCLSECERDNARHSQALQNHLTTVINNIQTVRLNYLYVQYMSIIQQYCPAVFNEKTEHPAQM